MRLIVIGDIIDKGTNSIGALRRVQELQLECILGNHEQKFLKWFHVQGSKLSDIYDRKDYYHQLTDQDITFIKNMPLYIELDDVIAVHAGLKPGIAMCNQKKNDLLYLRYTDDKREFISLKKIAKHGKEALGARFWTEFWKGPKSVVYGHQVHSLTDPLIEEVSPGVFCYGIDTGCVHNGHLSAVIWDTKEIVQVKAKQEYCSLNYDIDS